MHTDECPKRQAAFMEVLVGLIASKEGVVFPDWKLGGESGKLVLCGQHYFGRGSTLVGCFVPDEAKAQ